MSIEDPSLIPAMQRRHLIREEGSLAQPMDKMEITARLAEIESMIAAKQELGGDLYTEARKVEERGEKGGELVAKQIRDFALLMDESVDSHRLEELLAEKRMLKQRLAQLEIDAPQS